jgi:aspartate oxidase
MGKIISADALIIGGGVTARRAAKIIAEKHSVILVSDGSGASPYIHGLNVPLLESDSKELFLSDTMESGNGKTIPSSRHSLPRARRPLPRNLPTPSTEIPMEHTIFSSPSAPVFRE